MAPGVRTYIAKCVASSRINASRYIGFQNMLTIRDFVPFKAKIREAPIGLHYSRSRVRMAHKFTFSRVAAA